MHMSDALLNPAVAAGMYTLSTGAAAVCVSKLRKEENLRIPEMGVLGAFVFAGQMVNFTIPGTGASGHLCGGMMLSAMLGPEAGFISMIGILLIQCLFFGDGGLMALGANIWNMAFYGCFIGGGVIWRLIMKNGMNKKKITFASVLGCILTLQMGALSVTLQTLLSGITKLPFNVFAGMMLPIHLAIGLVEGIITAAVLIFIYESRPALLWNPEGADISSVIKQKSFRFVLISLAMATLVIAGGISLLASSNPDGLEWSIENVAGLEEVESSAPETLTADLASGIQEKIAFLPDYGFKNSDAALGTSVSGIAGSMLVVAFISLLCFAIRKKRAVSINNE